MYLLRVLLAAKFIERAAGSEYFKAVPNVRLADFEDVEIDLISAQIDFFYQQHSKELYKALLGVTQ